MLSFPSQSLKKSVCPAFRSWRVGGSVHTSQTPKSKSYPAMKKQLKRKTRESKSEENTQWIERFQSISNGFHERFWTYISFQLNIKK